MPGGPRRPVRLLLAHRLPLQAGTPPYPNRQRERIQNPRSVRSSRTGGTAASSSSVSCVEELAGFELDLAGAQYTFVQAPAR